MGNTCRQAGDAEGKQGFSPARGTLRGREPTGRGRVTPSSPGGAEQPPPCRRGGQWVAAGAVQDTAAPRSLAHHLQPRATPTHLPGAARSPRSHSAAAGPPSSPADFSQVCCHMVPVKPHIFSCRWKRHTFLCARQFTDCSVGSISYWISQKN